MRAPLDSAWTSLPIASFSTVAAHPRWETGRTLQQLGERTTSRLPLKGEKNAVHTNCTPDISASATTKGAPKRLSKKNPLNFCSRRGASVLPPARSRCGFLQVFVPRFLPNRVPTHDLLLAGLFIVRNAPLTLVPYLPQRLALLLPLG